MVIGAAEAVLFPERCMQKADFEFLGSARDFGARLGRRASASTSTAA
jgi:hypothetical protein